MTEILVLGPIGVRSDDGGTGELGPRQARLLAALVARQGEVVSVDRLADAVWEGAPPAGAETTLKSYVTRLRRQIDPDRAGLIRFERPGYLLDDRVVIDARTFEERLDAALESLRSPAPEQVVELVENALGAWRGPAHAGYGDEDWARPEAVRLELRRVEAQEALAEAQLALDRPEAAAATARLLVESEPLRERPRELLLRALHGSGRHAEALRVVPEFRVLLAEETGLEPSADLVALEARIAAGGATLGRTPRGLRGYELGPRIGAGAFAEVYLARQPQIGRDVALKVIRAELADRPDFVRSFETEATTVARLEHPHIVPLYDFWRDPGQAYLVMRYFPGGSLQRWVESRTPTPIERMARLVEQLCSALAVAHRAGVVHRDVKPANVLLDDDGNSFLADFGVATRAGETDDAVDAAGSSPLYASPEALRRQPVGPAADIYALAVMVHELLAGRPPFRVGATARELLDQKLAGPLPPLAPERGVDPRIDEVLAAAIVHDPAERTSDVVRFGADLLEAFEASTDTGDIAAARAAFAEDLGENPYRGLRAFDEGHADRFFGREGLVAELVDRLGTEASAVFVVGASGSGKSSAVAAGLVPALRRGELPGSERWFLTTMTPGDRPFEALEAALLRVAVNPPPSLLEQLTEGPRGLARAVRRLLPTDDGVLVLVVDQLEELFTQCDDPEVRSRFAAALATALDAPNPRLRLVATLRADFYDEPLRLDGLARLVKANTVAVTPLEPDELERAIVGPAEAVGARFGPGALAAIVADVAGEPGSLPVAAVQPDRTLRSQ